MGSQAIELKINSNEDSYESQIRERPDRMSTSMNASKLFQQGQNSRSASTHVSASLDKELLFIVSIEREKDEVKANNFLNNESVQENTFESVDYRIKQDRRSDSRSTLLIAHSRNDIGKVSMSDYPEYPEYETKRIC